MRPSNRGSTRARFTLRPATGFATIEHGLPSTSGRRKEGDHLVHVRVREGIVWLLLGRDLGSDSRSVGLHLVGDDRLRPAEQRRHDCRHLFRGHGPPVPSLDGEPGPALQDVIKVSGYRLGTAEIESALVSHKAVSEAATIGLPDEVRGFIADFKIGSQARSM